MNYQTIENKLDKEAPIRMRGLLRKRKESLKEFITKFFEEWNDEKETIYVNNGHVQTAPGCRRSLGDVYKICKYYYPKCTLKQVVQIVYKDCFDDIEGFRSSFCSATKKRMFYVDVNQGSEVYNKNIKDEFGHTWNEWIGEKEEDDGKEMDDEITDWDE